MIIDGHGQEFQNLMNKINQIENSKISIYHNFTDEVDYYKVHIWKCNGVCANKPPFFGIVKRSMNRPPQKADFWYAKHEHECGGIIN